jgi:hypothetical protein
MATDSWALMQHWDLVLPPSRPAAQQLARIQSQIGHLDRAASVAVLGSTPEFRDLLFENGFRDIYVLERNPTSFASMTGLRVYENTEHLIQGDWRVTLQHCKKQFRLILSDLTSGNLPYEDRSEFYDKVAGALADGGLFSDKVLTHPCPHIPLSEIIERYASLPLNLDYINRFSCEALFCSELLDIDETVNSSLFFATLDERVGNNRVKAFARQAQRITPPGFTWWYGRRWSELAATYCKALETISVHDDEPTSPYYGRLKMFLHTKR